MIPIPTPWLWAGAAAIAASGYILAGIQTVKLNLEETAHAETKLEFSRADSKALSQAIQDRDLAQAKADAQSAAFEAWKATQRPRVVAIKQEIRDAQAVDTVCASRPLPAGMLDALKRAPAAVGASDAGQPSPVPAMGPR